MKSEAQKRDLIPEQKKGAHSDTSKSIEFSDIIKSQAFYKIAKERLLNVSGWHKLGGFGSASFRITDSKGNKVERLVQEGDYIGIDIPGPRNTEGEGYDWVAVEKINSHEDPENDLEQISIIVKPASNPVNDDLKTAHFFDKDASSTFMVIRNKNVVTSEIHGRNELPNVKSESTIDSVRNTLVAIGAIFGLSKLQWSKLVSGIVENEPATE